MYNIPKGPIAAKILKDIRTKRLDRKYGQLEFGNKIDRSRATVSNIERKEGVLTKQILQNISKAFDKSIEELIPSDVIKRLEDPFAKEPTKLVASPKEKKPSEDLIESLKNKVLDLEEENINLEEKNKRVIAERDRLLMIIENMSKGVARS